MGGCVGLLLCALAGCAPSREAQTAGQIGCEPSEIEISGAKDDTDWTTHTENWVATCKGRRFVCSKVDAGGWAQAFASNNGNAAVANSTQIACKEALDSASTAPGEKTPPSAPPPVSVAAPASAPPTGGAGFKFGADAASTEQSCKVANNAWTPQGEGAFCSGSAAPLGFDAAVALRFCEGKLCTVEVRHFPQNWLGALDELRGKLIGKYGAPMKSAAPIPAECKTNDALVQCLEQWGLVLRDEWTWPTGEQVVLRGAKPDDGGTPRLDLTYTKRVTGMTANTEAL